MHPSSYRNMQRFVAQYCAPWRGRAVTVIDIGSQDVNGTYRPLFDDPAWRTIGLDTAPGINVDQVVANPYQWRELADACADIVISGQAFEHIEYFWLTMGEIARVLKPSGLLCLIAPSSGPEHRYPVDCWRFYPDGLRALARYAGLNVIECYAQWDDEKHPERDPQWQDCVLIANKPIYIDDPDFSRTDFLPQLQQRICTKTTWFGIPALKNPMDFWIYQELIHERRPDFIIEIGNNQGGSTLALAHLCDLLGQGQVIGIDISHRALAEAVRHHPRVSLLEGDACALIDEVRQLIPSDAEVLVVEDSAHTYENTLNVLRTYSPLVRVGGYFVVEDTICYHGLAVGSRPGAYEAVAKFLTEAPNFRIDRDREGFIITWNPKGFLVRVN